MKRFRDTWTIIAFAFWAIVNLWQEKKTLVSWKREYKQVILTVNFYNHLD